MTYQKNVLNKVGAPNIIPIMIGKLPNKKKVMRMGIAIGCSVSGCIAALEMLSARCKVSISSFGNIT